MFFEGIEGLYKIREHFSGDIKTKAKKLCETKFEFLRWMNDRCYYFHNKEVKIFGDAQKICSEMCGFDNGILYEPKDLENISKIYEPGHEFMCQFNLPNQQNDLFSKIFLNFIFKYFHLSIIQYKKKMAKCFQF